MATDKDLAGGKSSTSGAASKGPTSSAGSAKPESAGSTSKTPATGSGAKRPVTIDLKPEKVAAKPADKPSATATTPAKSAEAKPESKPTGAASATSNAKAAAASAAKPTSEARETKPTETSATADKAKEGEVKTASTASATAAGRASSGIKPSASASEGGGLGVFSVLVAAVFGGIVVLSGAYGLHVSGLLKLQGEMTPEASVALQRAEARITDLENKLAELSERSDPRALLTGLSDRITALEKSRDDGAGADLAPEVESLRSEFAQLRDQVAALPATGAPAGDDVAVVDLKTALDELAARVETAEASAKAVQSAVSTSDVSLKTLADSQARASETLAMLSSDIQTLANTGETNVGKLREQLDTLSQRLAAVEATMGDATAREVAARALSVSALKSAVDSGRPFETELAAVKAGLPEGTDLAALEAHAKTGVAPVSVLIAEFPDVARQMFAAFSAPDRSGDILDSLIAGAKSIVAVRGPGDESGTGPEAVLRRMENAVARGDLAASLEAYKDLPEVAQTVGADWASRAEARVAVDRMTEAASKEVLSMLASKDS